MRPHKNKQYKVGPVRSPRQSTAAIKNARGQFLSHVDELKRSIDEADRVNFEQSKGFFRHELFKLQQLEAEFRMQLAVAGFTRTCLKCGEEPDDDHDCLAPVFKANPVYDPDEEADLVLKETFDDSAMNTYFDYIKSGEKCRRLDSGGKGDRETGDMEMGDMETGDGDVKIEHDDEGLVEEDVGSFDHIKLETGDNPTAMPDGWLAGDAGDGDGRDEKAAMPLKVEPVRTKRKYERKKNKEPAPKKLSKKAKEAAEGISPVKTPRVKKEPKPKKTPTSSRGGPAKRGRKPKNMGQIPAPLEVSAPPPSYPLTAFD
eukprot:Platyproteum_vivax@DN3195_c0_g1_i1.p1